MWLNSGICFSGRLVVYIPGDIQKSTGHGPEQLAVGDPALRKAGGLGNLQRSLPESSSL